MLNARKQAVAGLVPPEVAEALIREEWPSVAVFSGPASLGRILICSIALAPLGWMLLLPVYFLKILPFIAKRYTLTNRRLMIRRGLKPVPSHEVALCDIDEVRVRKDANSAFYRAGSLEIISKGRSVLTIPGVPEPDSFRLSILNSAKAWAPGKTAAPIQTAKEATEAASAS
jgi:hypothetical protein